MSTDISVQVTFANGAVVTLTNDALNGMLSAIIDANVKAGTDVNTALHGIKVVTTFYDDNDFAFQRVTSHPIYTLDGWSNLAYAFDSIDTLHDAA